MSLTCLSGFEAIATTDGSSRSALIVEGSKEEISYEKLNNLSENVAEAIASTGLLFQHNENTTPLIGILMERHAGLIVSMLAVLKCGAGYVPVDPSFPPDRQSYIFNHSKCCLLLVDEKSHLMALSLEVDLPPVIVLSRNGQVECNVISEEINPHSSLILSRNIQNQRYMGGLMYVLYTSGSTGKPKGVMVRNASVLNIVKWFSRELHIDFTSRVLGLTTACFDISVLEIFLPLISGGTLILADSATQRDPFRLADLLSEERITVLQATPTTYEMLLAAGWKGDIRIDVLVGGEAFRSSLLSLTHTCRSVRNVYGPTETTIWSSCYLLPQNDTPPTPLPIGLPIDNTTFYVVQIKDTAALPVALVTSENSEGELYIGGIGVAAGYLHADDLTRAKFIRNPFGEGFVYATGDIVKRDMYGNYVFARRADDQVKVNGYRVELAEIEAVFNAHSLVRKAIAVVRDDRLVAYLQPSEGSSLSQTDLVQINIAAARKLTHYMMPKFIVVVERFPLTPNGKLDRNALPDYQEVITPAINPAYVESQEDSMASLVLKAIENTRGHCLSTSSSFSSISVDSLGATLFLKHLSNILGGLRIDTNSIYRPGVTVGSFSDELYNRLQIESPHILIKLGVSASGNNAGVDDDQREDVHSLFDDSVVNIRSVIEGLRGLLTIMVLFDHYHNHLYIKLPTAIQSDTSLFVLLSGFTSAMQLRSRPQYDSEKRYDIEVVNDNQVLASKEFNWKSFMLSRATGIFPVLWLTIIINIPYWIDQQRYYIVDILTRPDNHEALGRQYRISAGCSVLHVTALQTLWRPQCIRNGPDVYFASLIWITFLIWSLLRIFEQRALNIMAAWRRDPNTRAFSDESMSSFKRRVGNFAFALLYSLPGTYSRLFNLCVYWLLKLLITVCICLSFLELIRPKNVYPYDEKSPFAYFSYFVLGEATASVLESVHSLLPHGKKSLIFKFKLLRVSMPDVVFLLLIVSLSPNDLANTSIIQISLRWVIVPVLFAFYLIFSTMEEPMAPSLSGRMMRSAFMNLLGYCSYPIYLLQPVAFSYYAFAFGMRGDFRVQPEYAKMIGFVVLIFISYLIQRFFQDGLVAKVNAAFTTKFIRVKK